MKTVLPDEDHTFVVEFMEDGDFVVPDTGTVKWTLRDNDGTKISSDTSITTDDTTTQVEIVTPALANQKNGDVEKRTIIVDYKVNGNPKQIIVHYRIADWLNFLTSVEDVRNWIGIARHELPDEAINLTQVYYDVKLDAPSLPNALKDTTNRQFQAEMAILYNAVTQVIPTLQMRVSQSESDDQLSWRRVSQLDFDGLMAHARRLYTQAIRSIEQIDNPDGPTLFTVTNPSDPVTGGT